MIGVITGDIISSKQVSPNVWLRKLKKELDKIGKSPKYWEIFRGDSFQVIIKKPTEALLAAIKLKASIKRIKDLDVRMAIGIGEMTYSAKFITESNGSAFIYSGEKFDKIIKEKQNILIQSNWSEFDRDINLYLKLGLIIMDKWSVSVAEVVTLLLANNELSQSDIGKILKIKQNTVSESLKRAHINEIKEINEIYQQKLKLLM